MVGSTISGFALDSSDVDMCIVSRLGTKIPEPRYEAFQVLNDLQTHLQQNCRKLSFMHSIRIPYCDSISSYVERAACRSL